LKVELVIPDSLLLKLWLAHIVEGRELLTLESPFPARTMFVSEGGNSFTPSTLVHYWSTTMRRTAAEHELEYFRPSRARTIFVEEFSKMHGHSPELLDGAAAIMGNSVEQWHATYNPNRKKRLAEAAALAVAEGAEQEEE
jgi:hypothetical protein